MNIIIHIHIFQCFKSKPTLQVSTVESNVTAFIYYNAGLICEPSVYVTTSTPSTVTPDPFTDDEWDRL